MKDNDLFSVVILAYRNEQYLRCALDSILAQTYPSIEIIVADDGSPQFDLRGIEAYLAARSGPNILRTLVYQNPENLGTVQNINRAMAHGKGQYIKLLAADDALFDETVLEKARRELDGSESGIITSRVMRCGAKLEPIAPLRDGFAKQLPEKSARQVWRDLCVHNEVVAAGVFFTRNFWVRYGPFDERYRLLEDWPTWLRVTRQGVRIGYGDFFSAKYRGNAGSATSVNPAYLADKRKTFEQEIRPYRKELGTARYLRAWLTLRLRDSILVRKIYGLLFRR